GVPGYDAGGWHMFVAPAKTPKDIVNRLHSELKSITALPEMQQRFTTLGLIAIDSPSAEDLQIYVKSEIDRWGKVIRAAGIAESEWHGARGHSQRQKNAADVKLEGEARRFARQRSRGESHASPLFRRRAGQSPMDLNVTLPKEHDHRTPPMGAKLSNFRW